MGVSVTSAIGLTGAKRHNGLRGAVFTPRAGPRRRPRPASKTASGAGIPLFSLEPRQDATDSYSLMSPVKPRLTLIDPEISYQLYKNSNRHGVSVTSAIVLTGAKRREGLRGAVFGPRAGPRRRPRPASKTHAVSVFPGGPVKLRLTLIDPEISCQLYKNSKRHGVSVTFSDRFDGNKKPAKGLRGAVFGARPGPRRRPRRAAKWGESARRPARSRLAHRQRAPSGKNDRHRSGTHRALSLR
jgi:hypothetical protein